MKKYLFFILILINAKAGISQNGIDKKSQQDWEYYKYRTKISEPDYGLKKVREVVANEKTLLLDNKIYQSLSLREKFTYNMIYLESYSQICSLLSPESDGEKKTSAQLPSFGEFHWSQRQEDFFKSNKDSVVGLMEASIISSNRVGLNYKSVIEMINATKTIPLLIKTYNIDKKDHDILTVLMLLMKNNKYAAFINSPIYKELYATDESSYRTSISFNSSNEESIIKFANDFYNGLTK